MQVKVIKWFDYLWLTQKCSDEERAVSCLPDKLKVIYQRLIAELELQLIPVLNARFFSSIPLVGRLR